MEANVTLIDDKQCAEQNLYCSEGKGPFKVYVFKMNPNKLGQN